MATPMDEPEPDDLYLVPDEAEVQEAFALFKQIATLADMERVLGKPDEVILVGPNRYGTLPNLRSHDYHRRWKTIRVSFGELEDGTLDKAVGPKPKPDS